MSSEDNKLIVKNTLFLYVRLILTIIVNLYAVRVIWRVLGIEDYGIYNVVGGIVTMFSFLNNAMVASSQRFISFELGTGNSEKLKKVFSISVTVHSLLALTILILAETIGLWFLNNKLNIPTSRMFAANWVYQCSIIAFIVTVISVPYNACIVAHEHMKAYGYFGIIEVLLKLGIVFLLLFIPFDKLITYAILVVCVSIIMRLIYGIYCRKNFNECHFRFISDQHLAKDMFSFAGWSFLGNLGISVRDQGLNIVINLFFNVTVNAAKSVAAQIGSVVSGFSQSFMMAVNPQITKRYAAGETESMMRLVSSSCKYSAILMMFIVVPIFFAGHRILQLWLGDVAPYTFGFLKLTLIIVMIDAFNSPITTALQATGRIKWFQITISIIMLSNLPIAWIFLKLKLDPYVVMYVSILTSLTALIARLIILHKYISYSYYSYALTVFFRAFLTFIVSMTFSWILYYIFPKNIYGLLGFILVSVATTVITSFAVGLEYLERISVIRALQKRFC